MGVITRKPGTGGSGPTSTVGPNTTRPTSPAQGDQHFDTTLHKPLWFDSGWRDAQGILQAAPGGVSHAFTDSNTYTETYRGGTRVIGLEIPSGWGLPPLTAASRVWLTYPSGEIELTLSDDATWTSATVDVFSARLGPGTLIFMSHPSEAYTYTALRIFTP